MDRTLERELVQLGVTLGAELVREVVIPWLTGLAARGIEPVSALDVAREITSGIDDDHAELSGPAKAQLARDAIRQMLVNRGARPTERDVNKLLELSLE